MHPISKLSITGVQKFINSACSSFQALQATWNSQAITKGHHMHYITRDYKISSKAITKGHHGLTVHRRWGPSSFSQPLVEEQQHPFSASFSEVFFFFLRVFFFTFDGPALSSYGLFLCTHIWQKISEINVNLLFDEKNTNGRRSVKFMLTFYLC